MAPLSLSAALGCSKSAGDPFAGFAVPGGRALAAVCAFDGQCASGRCSADAVNGACGECVTIKAVGESCAGPHEGCSISAVCKGGICESVRKLEGEECALQAKGGDLGECDIELYCKHDDDNWQHGTCVRRAALGAGCGHSGDLCIWGASCQDGICTLPVPGACGYGYSCGYGYACGDDGMCHQGTLPEGAACGIIDDKFVYDCGPGLVCGGSSCVPLPVQGEPCIYELCADGLFCYRPPEDSTHPYCDAPRGAGEACSNQYYMTVACMDGLECRADTCQAACR